MCKAKNMMKDSIILHGFLPLIFLLSFVQAQQKYWGNSVMSCKALDEDDPSKSFLYSCNGAYKSCESFLIFRARYPYNSVPTIASLMSSDQYEIARINNVTRLTVFQTDTEVVIPVTCSCSGEHYQAHAMYQIPDELNTYFTIANYTYQGLSTCYSLKRANEDAHDEFQLMPGLELHVPLQCACPTKKQIAGGTKFLLTYSVKFGDSISHIGARFGVSKRRIQKANELSNENLFFPFTTILIPSSKKPFSSVTMIDNHKPKVSPLPAPTSPKNKTNRGLIFAGKIAGGLCILFLTILVAFCLVLRKKRHVSQNDKERKQRSPSPGDLIIEIASFGRVLRVFTFTELKKATGNFNNRSNIKGRVHRAKFKGQEVAVKKMSGNASPEVNMLYKLNHINLVKLHGFCEHKGETYLIFEYMRNGSLREWLNKKESKSAQSWRQRIQIAIDVANGLLYLHNFTKPAYVHKDIKSANILLDGNLRAKVSNFSLARKARNGSDRDVITTRIIGTKGYMAPECFETGLITPKVDVYAFGVVLLELITGKNAVFMQDGKEKLLSMTIAEIMGRRNAEVELRECIEPVLGENGGLEYAIQVVKLILGCLSGNPADRPNMGDVVSVLMKIQMCQQVIHGEFSP